MSEYDIHGRLAGDNALDATAISSDTTTAGEIIDTSGFNALEYFVKCDAFTDGAYAFLLQEGDDSGLSDVTTVPAEETIGDSTPTYTAAGEVFRIGTVGKKQFQRLSIVSTGTTSGATLSGIAVLGVPRSLPVADDQ